MPKYSYKCNVCEKKFDFYHSMTETILDCSSCSSIECMIKLPSKFLLFKQQKQKKTGGIVDAAIKDFREELQQEKEELRNKFYESDE